MEKIKAAARASGYFAFVDSDLTFSRPTVLVRIDRARAHDLGLSMKEIGDTLSRLTGEAYVNRFGAQGRAYDVIPRRRGICVSTRTRWRYTMYAPRRVTWFRCRPWSAWSKASRQTR